MNPRGVVVGGGVCGAFAAYFMAQRGWDVACIDGRGRGAASWSNPGGLNPLHGPGIPGPLAAFALESFAIQLAEHSAIARLSGIDYRFRHIDRVAVTLTELGATDQSIVENTVDRYRAAGGQFSAEWLTGDELRALEPRLAREIRGGLLTRGNATVDAVLFVRALGAAGAAVGVRHVAAQAIGLETDDARVTGVRTTDGVFSCEAVVIATGAWSEAAAAWLNIHVPVEPVAGEILVAGVGGRGPLPFDVARHGDDLTGIYDAGMGTVMLGGTETRAGFDVTPTNEAKTSITERVSELVPVLRDARVVDRLVGLRPTTPDELPFLGRAPGWDNVILAMGGGRKGVLLSAGMARASADLATDDATPLSVAALSPSRFASSTAAA